MTLRRPPADSSALAAFPVRAVAETYPYARIHLVTHEPEWFCSCGGHRFDPPRASSPAFGTCYLAGQPVGAFVEKFGDLGIVSRYRVDAHQLSYLQIPAARLADFTNRLALSWGVTGEAAAGGDYQGSQEWAERLFQAGYGGIWYTAKHDPQSDLHSVALFGKPGLHPEAFVSSWSQPIGADLLDDVETRFGIEVLPTTAL